MSDYPAAIVDRYTLDGKHYGLPKDMDTIGSGTTRRSSTPPASTYPDDDWTWDDFQAAAARADRPGQGRVRHRRPCSASVQEYQYNTIAQAGGYVISPDGRKSGYDDPKTIRACGSGPT